VAPPVRRRGGDDFDGRKKKERMFILLDIACVLFFTKQLHFLNLLILTFGFIFCHMSHIYKVKRDKWRFGKWSKDALRK